MNLLPVSSSLYEYTSVVAGPRHVTWYSRWVGLWRRGLLSAPFFTELRGDVEDPPRYVGIIDSRGVVVGFATITYDNVLIAVEIGAAATFERLQQRLERHFRYFNVVVKCWNILNPTSMVGENRAREDTEGSYIPPLR